MKKFISVLLVMVMTCSLLAGCSQEGGQTEKEEETTQQEAGGEEEETTKEGGYTIGCVIINDANTHCIAFADKFKEIVEGKGDIAAVHR